MIRAITVLASASASSWLPTGASEIVMAPPPRADATESRPTPIAERVGSGLAVASIARFAVWSQLRTTTSSTCCTPVTRGRNVWSSSP